MLIIFAIIATGIFLRFYNLENFGTFGHDNSRDLILLYKMYTYKEWIYRGPVFSLVWAFLSPIYYYILFPFYFLMKFHPLTPAIFSTFLNILALISMFLVSKNLFGRTASIISTLIYATSFLIIREGASGFNPAFMPVFSILFFYAIYKVTSGYSKYFILLAFCTAMLISFHPSGFFILPVMMMIIFIYRTSIKFKKKDIINSSLIFFVLGVVPYVFQEKKFNWWSIHKIVDYIQKPAEQVMSLGFVDLLLIYLKVLLNNLSTTFFGFSALPFFLLSITLSIILFSNLLSKEKRSAVYILSLFLIFYLIIFGIAVKFHKVGLYEGWFQTIYIPFIVLLFGANFAMFKHQIIKYAFYLILILSVVLNIFSYLSYKSEADKFYAQKEISEMIRKDSTERLFNIIGEDPQPFYYMLWYFEDDPAIKQQYYSWVKWGNNNSYDLLYYLVEKSNPPKSDANTNYDELLVQSNGRVLYRVTYNQ